MNPVVGFTLDALSEIGVDGGALARDHGFDPSSESMPRLLALAAREDPAVGLRAGAAATFRATNPVVYLMMSAPTLSTAFAGLGRFASVLFGRDSRLDAGRRGPGISLGWSAPPGPWTDFTAAVLPALCGWVVGRPVVPVEVRLTGPLPQDTTPYRAALGVVPAFGQPANAVVIASDDWASPSAHNDPALYELHRDFLETRRRRLADEALVVRAREAVAQRLGARSVDLDLVAKDLATSPRTLQRRLREHGTKFGEVVDGVRRDQVLLLLRSSDASLPAVAACAGFADVRALRRAFKRWTGTTPSAWRGRRPPTGPVMSCKPP